MAERAGEDAPGLGDFALWLVSRAGQPLTETEQTGQQPEALLHSTIITAITRLPRFARGYAKKVLAGTDLANPDEFGYLAWLARKGGMNKGELIQKNVHEVTTGTDILRRLAQKGFMEELPDPADRRSKLVRITPEGRQALASAARQMAAITDIVMAGMVHEELVQLASLLKKMDDFHFKIFQQGRGLEMEEIRQKYLGEAED